jgi:hypothetical protein
MQAREAIARAAAALPGDTPRLDAELLVAHLLGVDRGDLLLRGLDRDVDVAAADRLIARRAAGEPVAYIVGTPRHAGRTDSARRQRDADRGGGRRAARRCRPARARSGDGKRLPALGCPHPVA